MDQILESLSVFVISPFQDELAMMMWCVFLAVVLALGFTAVQRFSLGKAVKILMENGCFSEESAKSAKELGAFREKSVKRYDRMIETVKAEGKPNRYFLPEERKKKADALLKTASSPIWQILLGILGLYVLLAILYYILPLLLAKF